MKFMMHSMNLANIRKQAGLTQAELADRVGLTQGYISRIEKSDSGVTLGTLTDICQALDCTIGDLFGDERKANEAILISAFRAVPDERQKGWIDMAQQVLSSPEKEDQTAD